MNLTASLDLTPFVLTFQREIDELMSDMFQLCAAASQKRYTDDTVQQVGLMGVIVNAESFGETAPQRATRTAFVSAMSKLKALIDRLIATIRITKTDITLTRVLQGEEEVKAYVSECLDAMIAEVARDPKLNVPKKLEFFTGIDPVITEMVLGYNALRNALEHHHDLPKRDLPVTMRRIAILVGDQEITAFPTLLPAGGALGIKTINIDKVFPANQKVVLDLQDGHDLLFTLKMIVAPAIFAWHIGPGNPKPTPALAP